MIHLRVLGGIDLKRSNGEGLVGVPVQSKRVALLVYLVLAAPREIHRRDRLLALFWPELDSARARNALSQALHALRRSLGEGVVINRGEQEVGIAPGSLTCDALEFEAALAQDRRVEALELYRGDLLDGFYLAGASLEFERWIEEERERLKAMALDAARAAAREQARQGNAPLALHLFRHAVRLAPYDEAALRELLEIQRKLGDRAGAIASFEAFERRLRGDLEIEPSADLRDHLEEIRSSARPPARPADPVPLATPPDSAIREQSTSIPNGHTIRRGGGLGRASAVAAVLLVALFAAGLLALTGEREGNSEGAAARSAPPAVGRAASAAGTARSIAVLPFLDLSSSRDQQYISDGLAEELSNALAQVPGLHVAARTSAFAFRERSVPVEEIARELGVAYLVEGSVRRTGDRLRVRVQLVRADGGYHVWSQTYERSSRDVFAVQEDIARQVVHALEGRLSHAGEGDAAGSPPPDFAAYESYLKGRYFWNLRTGEALDRAIAEFEASIARDSAYAPAYAGLADTYNLFAALGFAPGTTVYPRARAAALRALELDPDLAGAAAALGFVLVMNDGDPVAGEIQFRRAIERNPNYAPAHQWYSQTLAAMGRYDESRREIDRARELDPLSLAIKTDWARDALFARRYDMTVERLQGSLDIDPDYARAHSYLAIVYAEQGRLDAAIEEFQRAIVLAGGWWPSRFGQAGLARAYALAGRREEAEAMLAEIAGSTRYVSPEALALVHVALGDNDAALDALDKAWAERALNLGWLVFDPAWDPLRADPRFTRLLEQMGVSPVLPAPASWVAE